MTEQTISEGDAGTMPSSAVDAAEQILATNADRQALVEIMGQVADPHVPLLRWLVLAAEQFATTAASAEQAEVVIPPDALPAVRWQLLSHDIVTGYYVYAQQADGDYELAAKFSDLGGTVANGVCEVTLPSLEPGSHSFYAMAWNAISWTQWPVPLTFGVGGAC